MDKLTLIFKVIFLALAVFHSLIKQYDVAIYNLLLAIYMQGEMREF